MLINKHHYNKYTIYLQINNITTNIENAYNCKLKTIA